MSMEDLCIGCHCNDDGICVCMTSCPREKEFKKRREQKERKAKLMYDNNGMCENCLKADVCKLQEENKKIRDEILRLSNEHELLVQIGCKYFANK